MSAGSGSGIKGEEQTLDTVAGELVGVDAVTVDGEVLGDTAKVGDNLPIMKTSWFADGRGDSRKDKTFTFSCKTSAVDGLRKKCGNFFIFFFKKKLKKTWSKMA